MPREPLFSWEGHEYAFEEHGADWYWALGIITIAAILTAILFSNFLLALVVLASGVTIGLQAAKHKKVHRFNIYDNGISIDSNLYLFKDMRDFGILEYIDSTLPPALSIKTNHILAPHLLIPINDYDPDEIYFYVSNHLPEGMHDETLIDRFAAFLRI